MEPVCLKCGKVLDYFTELEPGALPQAGDISVCLYCANIAIFTGNGIELRAATEEEAEEALGDKKVALAITITRMYMALKGK